MLDKSYDISKILHTNFSLDCTISRDIRYLFETL